MRYSTVLALVTSGLVACENPTEPARPAASSERGKVASPGIGPAQAGTQTITLVSGNGPIGGRDPENRVSEDGGVTFQDAFILAPDPAYAPPVSGSQWISGQPGFLGPGSTSILYRRTFTLPPGITNSTFTIEVHADNVATIFLNGTQIGQQPFEDIPENFQGPPDTFTAPSGVLHSGTNTLAIDVFNFGFITGLDYKATITIEACTLEALLDGVEALVAAGNLSRDQGHALSVKLAAALHLLERGKTKAAGNVIGAFLNQVGALVRSRRLSDADAGLLRDQAACVRTQLHG
jgi:Beta-galactosidase jelly roll domain